MPAIDPPCFALSVKLGLSCTIQKRSFIDLIAERKEWLTLTVKSVQRSSSYWRCFCLSLAFVVKLTTPTFPSVLMSLLLACNTRQSHIFWFLVTVFALLMNIPRLKVCDWKCIMTKFWGCFLMYRFNLAFLDRGGVNQAFSYNHAAHRDVSHFRGYEINLPLVQSCVQGSSPAPSR